VTLARRIWPKAATLAAVVLDTTLKNVPLEVAAIRCLTVIEKKSDNGRPSDSNGTGKQSAREPPPFLNTKKCAGVKHYLFDCLHTSMDEVSSCWLSTRRRDMLTGRMQTSKLWAEMERRRETEMARLPTSRRNISESRSKSGRHRLQLLSYTVQCSRGRKEA
jgi:hypothetical protein